MWNEFNRFNFSIIRDDGMISKSFSGPSDFELTCKCVCTSFVTVCVASRNNRR